MKPDTQPQDYSCIVGIGASAGGLETLQKLLSALSPNTGFPYIIVQHLSPDYKSLLGEILNKYTEMPVIQAEDGMAVERNQVYVIQPGKNMRIEEGRLRLVNQIPKGLNLPIDIFFRSLAEEAGARAIAIVLSGTGSDGTNGIKAIKENEGMVIVQDLESAKFDGMPRSALRTGLVDAQLTPEAIAMELQHISQANATAKQGKSLQEPDSELMRRVYLILKKSSNVNFTHYKQTTILRRIERRMMLTHSSTLSDYVALLQDSPEEVHTLSKEVLIGVTSFFRDPDFFQLLKDTAITDILTRSAPDEPVRIWVAGCSTGEEAYSIAILVTEVMEALHIRRDVKIFATDLDTEAIATAGKGVYGDHIVEAVSAARLSRFFTRRNNTYTVNRDIRRMIVFSPHNVFQDPPFGRLDLISCRNMLIYFQSVLQNDLFAIFHQAIRDKGYLFLGKSEAIGAYTDAFPVVHAAAKLFTHCSEARIPGAKKIPYIQTTYLEGEFSIGQELGSPWNNGILNTEGNQKDVAIDNYILVQFMPACLVVNEKNELVHTYGDTANMVHLSHGQYSNNLFDLITDELKIPVSTLLKEARKKKGRVQYREISFMGEREAMVIDLTIAPASKNNTETENLFALVFTPHQPLPELAEVDSVEYDIGRASSQRITDLEHDLTEIQGQLDRSVADQECVNEELQAANEELLTANEELQSSNEELQSVNEELYTVNSEYQQKLAELSDLNDDLANFLSSTLTGIIFVDNRLNIRRYTDYVTHEFSVMDHDIGRSLAFISYHFPAVDITAICTNVLNTMVPDEREVTTTSNKVFFMRVAPYRSTENKILGCVITLMDVTSQKRSQAILQSTEKRLSITQQASDAKSDYLFRIAQEIRTPMTSLLSLTKIAQQQVDQGDMLRISLDKISNTVDYMTSIVTDISEASMGERLTGEQGAEPFSLRDVLDSVAALVEPKAGAAGLAFEVAVEDGFNPQYVASRAAVKQILLNFLTYMVRHTAPGGAISLRSFEEPSREDRAVLCVVLSATGADVCGGHLSRMAHSIAHPEEAGPLPNGLNPVLSTAYHQIAALDGEVSATAQAGGEIAFTIKVQLERCVKPEGPLGVQAPEGCALAGRHVLIAEDNALNRTILGALLSSEGMTYVETANGLEAVSAFVDAPDYTFDCILLDTKMPKLDGIQAASQIRESGKLDARTIPIIGVSACGFSNDIPQARKSGIDEYTTKPIDRDSLLSSMGKLMVRSS